MLSFYHDLGRIIYFGNLCEEKSYLNNMVILNPQWLIDVLKEVITFADPRTMVDLYILLGGGGGGGIILTQR